MLDMIELLALPFLTCLAMVGILGYLGLHVVKREIIFIDIALAQIAVVGAIVAHVAFHEHGGGPWSHACAVGVVLGASAFYAVTRRDLRQIPLEAVIGVSYAIAAAGALFLVGVAPGGHVHVQHMLAGSLLWVTAADLVGSLAVFAAAGVVFGLLRRRFARLSEAYDAAAAAGENVLAWDFLFYALTGGVITVAVRICGVILVFSFLIIPAVISILLAKRSAAQLAVAWGAGAIGSLLGLLFARRLDFSMGPSIAALLGVTLVLVAGVRRCHRLIGAALVAAALVGYGLALAAGGRRGDAARRLSPPTFGRRSLPATVPALGGGPAGQPSPVQALAEVTDLATLERLFQAASTPGDRTGVVERAAEVGGEAALELAVRFLREDPPLFFRQQVIQALRPHVGELAAYDFTKPFAAAANRKCIERVRQRHDLPGP